MRDDEMYLNWPLELAYLCHEDPYVFCGGIHNTYLDSPGDIVGSAI